jgi:hypothetical protein
LNPVLWLDAADTATITESGGSVSQWNDKSGNGYIFTQGTGAAQPKTGTRTQNGLNVLDFDGNDSLISTAAVSAWTFLHDGTKFIVCSVTARDTSGTNGTIMTTGTAGNGLGFQFRYVSNNVYSHLTRGNNIVCLNDIASGTSTTAVTLTVFSDVSNSTVAERSIIFVNNGNGGQLNSFAGTPSSSNPPASLTIGNRQTNALPLDGFIAELIIVPEVSATLNNLFLLRQYLLAKWGTA